MSLPRFMLTPARITRFLILFILLWILACLSLFQTTLNSALTDKQQTISSMSSALQTRIETYRAASAQLYDVVTGSDNGAVSAQPLQMVMPGIYQLETEQSKTSLLIFGALSDPSVSHAREVSAYLNTLWAAKHNVWSMYLLNGQDNSMLMVSTLPIATQQLTTGRDNPLTTLLDTRRTEMLQQANALDERESFSQLRYDRLIDDHYFTLRTTFNQPGHLPTVIAFDIPVGDIIPERLTESVLQLKAAPDGNNQLRGNSQLSFVTPDIEISSTLAGLPLRLVYHLPLFELLGEALHQILWPLLINLITLLLVVYWLLLQRNIAISKVEIKPDEAIYDYDFAQEIVSSLPVGLIVYDFSTDTARLTNHQADPLLPHLNLRSIIDITTAHDGGIQVTINHRNYEVRAFTSVIEPENVIFIICDRDREALISRTLQDAENALERSHQIRRQLFRHLAEALDQPVAEIVQLLANTTDEQQQKAEEKAIALRQQVDDFIMLYQLEAGEYLAQHEHFNLQQLLDTITALLVPVLNRKGLGFYVTNLLPPETQYYANKLALQKILSTLLHYAVVRTAWGKITLSITPVSDTALTIDIIDSSDGLTKAEETTIDFPFAHLPPGDRFSQPSALALFLCKHLCPLLDGDLSIHNHPGIGTHYQLNVSLLAEPQLPQEEKLLEGVVVRLEIASDIIQRIVMHQLQALGATIILSNQTHEHDFDITLTDNSASRGRNILILDSKESQCRLVAPECWTVNFNLYYAVQDALLMIIAQQLEQEDPQPDQSESAIITGLSEDYWRLFSGTVPEDIRKLYTAFADREYHSLAQIAHRLKGVFAILELLTGQQLCERLEAAIREQDSTTISTLIDEVNGYINTLLQQGRAR